MKKLMEMKITVNISDENWEEASDTQLEPVCKEAERMLSGFSGDHWLGPDFETGRIGYWVQVSITD